MKIFHKALAVACLVLPSVTLADPPAERSSEELRMGAAARVEFDSHDSATRVGGAFPNVEFANVGHPQPDGDIVDVGALVRLQLGLEDRVDSGDQPQLDRGFGRAGIVGLLRFLPNESVSPVLTVGTTRMIDATSAAHGGISFPLAPGTGAVWSSEGRP
jgi:hypothetical protein